LSAIFAASELEIRALACHQDRMNVFRQLADDHPDLTHSPLLRAAQLTLQYAIDENSIGLTQTKAFKRTFVHWAAEHFDWPGRSFEDLFRYNKILNEYDFTPLQLTHFLLISRKLGRHYKGAFRATKKGKDLVRKPGALFHELIPFYVLDVDHTSYGRLDERPFGKWDVWLNVTNVEAENGISERKLFGAFYGEGPDWDNAGWREMAAFSHYVLTPLKWSGLISVHEAEDAGRFAQICFKTPLWRSALQLETDDILERAAVH
jgi:hypothetical protein